MHKFVLDLVNSYPIYSSYTIYTVVLQHSYTPGSESIYMANTQQTIRTVKNEPTATGGVQTEQTTTHHSGEDAEFALGKMGQFLWYIGHFIAVLLGLRFIFFILGANQTGIVQFIYALSSIFVLPFRNIFPSPRTGEFYFDTAALLGIAMYYLLIFLIIKLIALFSNRTPAIGE